MNRLERRFHLNRRNALRIGAAILVGASVVGYEFEKWQNSQKISIPGCDTLASFTGPGRVDLKGSSTKPEVLVLYVPKSDSMVTVFGNNKSGTKFEVGYSNTHVDTYSCKSPKIARRAEDIIRRRLFQSNTVRGIYQTEFLPNGFDIKVIPNPTFPTPVPTTQTV